MIRGVYRYRRKLSWTLSIVLSLLVIGSASEIASAFVGLNGQYAVSGAVTLFVIAPYWVWSYRRGRFPIIRIGSPSRMEEAKFNAWRSSREEATQVEFNALREEELAEFNVWRSARALRGGIALRARRALRDRRHRASARAGRRGAALPGARRALRAGGIAARARCRLCRPARNRKDASGPLLATASGALFVDACSFPSEDGLLEPADVRALFGHARDARLSQGRPARGTASPQACARRPLRRGDAGGGAATAPEGRLRAR